MKHTIRTQERMIEPGCFDASAKGRTADRVTHITEEILQQLEQSHKIAGLLVFGSASRGDIRSNSDVDVICLLDEHRGTHYPVYLRTRICNTEVDLNILDAEDAGRLLSEPSWQYRFIDTRSVPTVMQTDDCVTRWLSRLKQLLNSQQGWDYRIVTLAERVDELAKVATSSSAAGNHGRETYAWALCLFERLRLACELRGVLPYSAGNPVLTLHKAGALLPLCSEWPLPPYSLPTSAEHLREYWTCFRKLLDRAREQIWPAPGPLQDGLDEADLLPVSQQSMPVWAKVMRLFREAGWQTVEYQLLGVTSDPRVLATRHIFEKEVQRSLWPVRKVSRNVRTRSEPRHVAFDTLRKRVKVIIPTGGCRVRSCVFCQLPNLAAEPKQMDWHKLIPAQQSEVDEVAIYTDGSFFDDRELTPEERRKAIERAHEIGAIRLSVETLPRFLDADRLSETASCCGNSLQLSISTGLQTMDSRIRQELLGTPVTDEEIQRMFTLKIQFGFALRVFLLYGKPLLTAAEDLKDVKTSIDKLATRLTREDQITVNQLRPATSTVIGDLLEAGFFVEPDLCDLRGFVEQARKRYKNVQIEPGCISVRTCTSSREESGRSCVQCMEWLGAAETHRTLEGGVCRRIGHFDSGIPWQVLGSLNNRSRFARSVLSRQGDE